MSDIPEPWYKQFWPWFLIFVPVLTLVMSTYLIVLAFNTEDSMVIDDYYKSGKAINQQLAKIEQAKALNIRAKLYINQSSVRLTINADKALDGSALRLVFHHATIQRFDFELLLTQNASGDYTAQAHEPISGKWALTLLPFDQAWKLQQNVKLPRADGISLNSQ